ncbi:hypothetical protein [uncultured Deinococcus sp.]|uniref:hypothetical protein n=1 Tax=uncultured Deinococcus sp. TaxID=158789 RepID=UPI0025FD6839|nr:hypothetical protein [uncultured Deinococcus sp.]
MRFAVNGNLQTDKDGFARLALLYQAFVRYRALNLVEPVIIDLSGLTWIDANMCAPLGGVLARIRIEYPDVKLIRPNVRNVLEILTRNGFLPSIIKVQKTIDRNRTTVAYRQFAANTAGEREFAGHVHSVIEDRDRFSTSNELKRALLRNILEIFNNSVTHSGSRVGVFACGQYYPQKHRMRFTVTDIGAGIRTNVSKHLGDEQLTAIQAIEWAVKKGNTTKINVPGGLGLGLLFEFVTLNGGTMQIISSDGFWQLRGGQTVLQSMPSPFPGTSVSITINTNVEAHYLMKSETPFDLSNIF